MGSIAGKTGALLTIDIDGAGSGTVKQLIFLENVSLTTINPNQLVSSGVILLDNTPPQSGLNPNHLISGGVILA
jgi:hypothetical protein